MKLSSILLVRRAGTKIAAGLRYRSCHPSVGIELICVGRGLGGKCAPDTQKEFVIHKVIDMVGEHKNTRPLKVVLDMIIDRHKPGLALLLVRQKDPLSQILEKMILENYPGIGILRMDENGFSLGSEFKETYLGPPIEGLLPMAAFPVSLDRFKGGHELADYLGMGNPMPGGIAFLWGRDSKGDPKSGKAEGLTDTSQGLEVLEELLSPWLNQKSSPLVFSLEIYVQPGMDFSRVESRLGFWYQKGLRMIHWQLAPLVKDLPRALLWQVSKQGIWNHVSGKNLFGADSKVYPENPIFGAWIANTPNIVHSFENTGFVNGRFLDPVSIPDDLLDYGRLAPLPNIPLWQTLQDPGIILAILGQTDKKELTRVRVDPSDGAVSRLGQKVKFFFKTPGKISPDILDEIVAMVDAGGSVDITHVRANLEKAFLIGYGVENGRIVGNSSLKHPRQVFIDRIKGITGFDFTHCVERGYTSVRPEYRAMGIGARLLEGLTKRAGDKKIFSIISEDNQATQKIAVRNKTRKITTYYSEKLKKEMGVWMPAHMSPDQEASQK